jgi:hypothetical protein
VKNTDAILVQKSLTKTGYTAYCIAMLKDVIKVSLWQKGQNDRFKNIVSVFDGIQCSLNNFELSATINVVATVKIHRKHYSSCVTHWCTSGTGSHQPLSNY